MAEGMKGKCRDEVERYSVYYLGRLMDTGGHRLWSSGY